ncbi:hypothetical protein CALVIDRAFT_541706 [Calocera viscosa TUFC12733]|uniref:Uncharacterized protein n=1 Tax=Calocera viscosa (strain TUFC12733) TaxID=1330018 RepID=A0A167HEC3_CALVF|nr:hypothetical protein CALVIDRAFT_541706 [Calocera viscosa TUFC12733]
MQDASRVGGRVALRAGPPRLLRVPGRNALFLSLSQQLHPLYSPKPAQQLSRLASASSVVSGLVGPRDPFLIRTFSLKGTDHISGRVTRGAPRFRVECRSGTNAGASRPSFSPLSISATRLWYSDRWVVGVCFYPAIRLRDHRCPVTTVV